MIGDVWRELRLSVKWYQWWGKNQHHLRDLQSKWSISEKHLIRSCSYKGNIEDVITMPGLKYDSGSTLGVFVDIRVPFANQRTCSSSTGENRHIS